LSVASEDFDIFVGHKSYRRLRRCFAVSESARSAQFRRMAQALHKATHMTAQQQPINESHAIHSSLIAALVTV